MQKNLPHSSLAAFGQKIQKLIEKQNLTRSETHSAFLQILKNEQPELHQGAFLSALVAKGETSEEISGAWQAIQETDTVAATLSPASRAVENCGTGMDSLKTFNASSAAAVVAASCGITMTRHGSRALSSFCGTVDILESIGLDVNCEVPIIEKSIERTGIGLFNGMSHHIHPSALGRILSQIRFGSTLNIAASLANPAKPRLAVRGVYSPDKISLVARVMREIGTDSAMVVCGHADDCEGFMDELSPCGMTRIEEWSSCGEAKQWTLSPEDAGLTRCNFSQIAATGDIDKESFRFLQTLSGNGLGPCADFTCLNAAAILRVAGVCHNLKEGVSLARMHISKGLAFQKLKDWVCTQNSNPKQGLETLQSWLPLKEKTPLSNRFLQP